MTTNEAVKLLNKYGQKRQGKVYYVCPNLDEAEKIKTAIVQVFEKGNAGSYMQYILIEE